MAAVDLTNCDRERIHIPGSVQPQGALLVVARDTLQVRQAGGANAALLGVDSGALLGMDLTELLTPVSVERLRDLIARADLTRPRHLLNFAAPVEGKPLDASVHAVDAGIVIEFELADLSDPISDDPLAVTQAMLTTLGSAGDVEEFCQTAAEELRRVTGYDRVMIYRFLADDSGCVVAEAKAAQIEAFLGLRYPASDIPKQARALYLNNWLRIIATIDYDPAPLISDDAANPLDMSQAILRSVSPVHLEYLRNMGTTATMTISIIKGGQLWGLIACHHNSPKPVPRHLRAVCEMFGNMFAFQLDARERADALEDQQKSSGVHNAILTRILSAQEVSLGDIGDQPSLLDYLDADGVVSMIDGRYEALGSTPREANVRNLARWLDHQTVDGLFATNSLATLWDEARDFAIEGSGVLAISASRTPSDYVIWFRRELIETVRWAGDPNKPVEAGPLGDRLTPRKSFAAWSASVRYESKPWSANDIAAARIMRTSLLEIILRRIDVVARERGEAQERHKVMVAELNHRVKNTLATIQALARYTHKSSASLESYVLNFEQRIQALSASHNLLTDGAWEKTDLQALVTSQVRPYQQGNNVTISGPETALTLKATAPMGMVLHELATNAVKYGGLSGVGHVVFEWNIGGRGNDRRLYLRWRESGGPAVVAPTREGFGTFTLRRIIPFQCGGHTEVRYAPGGFECDIELPADCFDGTAAASTASMAAGDENVDAIRVLIVEDEAMVAFDIENGVLDLGWQPVGPVSRVKDAIELAQSEQLDAAMLDVNVAGELIWPVANALQARGIPFMFLTGYDQTDLLGAKFAGVPVIGKPFTIPQALAVLKTLVVPRVDRSTTRVDAQPVA